MWWHDRNYSKHYKRTLIVAVYSFLFFFLIIVCKHRSNRFLSLLRSDQIVSSLYSDWIASLTHTRRWSSLQHNRISAQVRHISPPLAEIDASIVSTIRLASEAFASAFTVGACDDLVWIAHGGQISSYNWNLIHSGTIRTHLGLDL